MPRIQRAQRIVPDNTNVDPPPQRSPLTATPTKKTVPVTFPTIPGGRLPITQARLVSQTALATFVTTKALFKSQEFTPRTLTPPPCTTSVPNYAHFASLMVHPVTGKTISSYKRLMNNLATAKIWQTAFGKDFGGMAQGMRRRAKKGRTQCSS